MIICRKCSRRHVDGTQFCDCGAYLEFDGEHIVDDPAAAADTSAASTATSPTTAPSPTRDPWRDQEPTSSAASEPEPWSLFEPAKREATSRPGDIDAVHPDSPRHAGVTEPIWVEPGGRPGDTACRQCGTPNDPTRFFCRHCGASLSATAGASTSESVRRPPWWKRIFSRARSRASTTDPTLAARRVQGIARGGLSGRTLMFRTGGIIVVLGALLAFLGPWRGPVLARSRQLLGGERHDAIDVSAEEVGSSQTGAAVTPAPFELQPASNVVDRFANTAWATRWLDETPGFESLPDDEACQPAPMTDSQLDFQFAEQLDIARIQVLGGRPEDDPSRPDFRRPRVLELQVDDQSCSYLLLEDVAELQAIDFEHDDVSRLRVRIVGVFEAKSEAVEISEIVLEE